MTRTALPYTALLLVACGAHAPTTPTTAADAPATPGAATAASPAKATGHASPRANPELGKVLADFPGPKVAPAKGETLWAFYPQLSSWDRGDIFLSRLSVERVEGTNAVLAAEKGEVVVPGAFTRASSKTPFKVGQAVIVSSTLGGFPAEFGRITRIDRSDAGSPYQVTTISFAGVLEGTAAAEAMLPLDDRLSYGAPVTYQEGGGGAWLYGMYIGPGNDAGKAWILAASERPEQHAGVKPIVVSKVFKKGDKVLADHASSKETPTESGAVFGTDHRLEPATVTEVMAAGVAYKVKRADGEEETVGLHQVTAPF